MMPIFCTAGIAGPGIYSSNMRIPINDDALMFYRFRWSYEPLPAKEIYSYEAGEYIYPKLIPGTFIPTDNKSNDYNVDRVAQRNYSYSGIKTFPLQDIAMMEDQRGALMDRRREHLASSDEAIIRVRRRLMEAALALKEQGTPPPASSPSACSATSSSESRHASARPPSTDSTAAVTRSRTREAPAAWHRVSSRQRLE